MAAGRFVQHTPRNPKLILIICGSVSSWIESNILCSTGFVGRISLDLQVQELPIADAAQFWGDYRQRVSAYDKLQVLAITGGIPRYLEEIVPKRSAEENIRSLCFEPEGLLLNEFESIFSDVFSVRTPLYQEVLIRLAEQSLLRQDLISSLQLSLGGDVSRYLADLNLAGFVSADSAWDFRSLKESRFKRYRLSDNYTRFYLRYIRPQKRSIEQGAFRHLSLRLMPGWDAMMGLQFENLVINNAHRVVEELQLTPADIVQFGPFFQRQTKRARGCQVDLLLQARHRTLYLCELKFSASKIGLEAARQAKRTLDSIQLPRGWTARTVLVHVNGVTRELEQSRGFDHIVNFGSLL